VEAASNHQVNQFTSLDPRINFDYRVVERFKQEASFTHMDLARMDFARKDLDQVDKLMAFILAFMLKELSRVEGIQIDLKDTQEELAITSHYTLVGKLALNYHLCKLAKLHYRKRCLLCFYFQSYDDCLMN
jgi:hypothetical protein